MVRNYKRKTNRHAWSEESMHMAMEAVLNNSMGYYKASNQFNVPQTTLERHVAKKRKNPEYNLKKTLGPFTCVFNEEQENELVKYLTIMESQMFGLTIKEMCQIAYQLAERNNIKHPFNQDNCSAGRDWAKGFLARNRTLSIRKPEATSAGRAMGFNKVAVNRFFDLLTDQVDKFKLTGDRIFNVDETGMSVNPKGHSKIIALKGRRQVGTLTSAERGQNVTAEICFSAAGVYIPPMVIFPRKRMKQEFETGLPPGSTAEVHESGWMTTELFFTWFRKFVAYTGASKEKRILLILDGHKTHTKNIELIDMARENGVILLCLPPHCSHRLQPLDLSFMKPLSKYYEDEVRKWLRTHPGRVVTLHQVASLFGQAYISAATMSNAVNGFRKSGIWPVDRNVFTEADFLPSKTTDIGLDLTAGSTADPSTPTPCGSSTNVSKSLSLFKTNPSLQDNNCQAVESTPSTSGLSTFKANENLGVSSFQVSPEVILPVPKVDQTNKRKSSSRCGKTAVLTESPYKAELMEAQNKPARKSQPKKKLFKEQPEASTSKEGTTNPLLKKKKMMCLPKTSTTIPKARLRDKGEESSETSDAEDNECLYCMDYSEEGWIRCAACYRWAHNSCAGVDSDEDVVHVCVICEK